MLYNIVIIVAFVLCLFSDASYSNIRLCPPLDCETAASYRYVSVELLLSLVSQAGRLNAFTNLCNFRQRRCQTLITLSWFRNVKDSLERHVYNVTTIRKLHDSMSRRNTSFGLLLLYVCFITCSLL